MASKILPYEVIIKQNFIKFLRRRNGVSVIFLNLFQKLATASGRSQEWINRWTGKTKDCTKCWQQETGEYENTQICIFLNHIKWHFILTVIFLPRWSVVYMNKEKRSKMTEKNSTNCPRDQQLELLISSTCY